MALSFKQRRRRDIVIGIFVVAILVSFAMRKQILPILLGPGGFSKHAPVGQFTQLDWSVIKQAKLGKDGYQVPQAVASLDGKPVSIHGYTFPLSEARETNKVVVIEKAHGDAGGHEHEHEHEHELVPPSLNEAFLVCTAGEKNLQISSRSIKVGVYGTLLLDTNEKSGALYTINDAVVVLER